MVWLENGTIDGRWHFSFDQYFDRDFSHFGTLRVFNDDTLSPSATWPLHSHRNIEVVTYCASGVFRHADQFLPRKTDLEPSLQQKPVERAKRTNILLPLVSNQDEGALPIASDARIYSSFLEKDKAVGFELGIGRGEDHRRARSYPREESQEAASSICSGGVEAPAVIATVSIPSNHSCLSSPTSSIW